MANIYLLEYHGTDGPLSVVSGGFTRFSQAWIEAGKEMGWKEVDYNGEGQEGTKIRNCSSFREYLLLTLTNTKLNKQTPINREYINTQRAHCSMWNDCC